MGEKRSWSTNDELCFIKNLGTLRPKNKRPRPNTGYTRKMLLEKYIKAAAKRKNWLRIEKAQCLKAARNALRNERRRKNA